MRESTWRIGCSPYRCRDLIVKTLTPAYFKFTIQGAANPMCLARGPQRWPLGRESARWMCNGVLARRRFEAYCITALIFWHEGLIVARLDADRIPSTTL